MDDDLDDNDPSLRSSSPISPHVEYDPLYAELYDPGQYRSSELLDLLQMAAKYGGEKEVREAAAYMQANMECAGACVELLVSEVEDPPLLTKFERSTSRSQ